MSLALVALAIGIRLAAELVKARIFLDLARVQNVICSYLQMAAIQLSVVALAVVGGLVELIGL